MILTFVSSTVYACFLRRQTISRIEWLQQFVTLQQSCSTSHVITATHYLSNAHQQEKIHKEPHHIHAGQSDFKNHIWKKKYITDISYLIT
jgi:hypothetical protein